MPLLKGIITKVHNNIFTVLELSSKKEFLAKKKKSYQKLVVGDVVNFKNNIIINIELRKNLITKPLLANIDNILFVVSITEPDYSFYLIDSFLCYYTYLGITPVLIFNKQDLSPVEQIEKLKIYTQLGYSCFFVSALQLNENEKLQLTNILSNKTIAFAGSSGVGKSTLINQIFSDNFIKTDNVSEKIKRGKQTTTQSTLYYNSTYNCFLADTPGYSMIEISALKDANINALFPEFKDLTCKFDNCKHVMEPNCAIKDAVSKNIINSSRYDSYLKLTEEIKNLKPKY